MLLPDRDVDIARNLRIFDGCIPLKIIGVARDRIVYMIMRYKALYLLIFGGWLCATLHAQAIGDGLPASPQERELKADLYYYQGVLEASRERHDAALALLSYSYRLDPSSGATAYALGLQYGQRYDMERAQPLLEQAYASDSTNRDYLEPLASVYISQTKPAQAIALLERWLVRHPDDESIQRSLGSLYLRSGEYDKAIELYGRLQQESKGSFDDYVRLTAIKTALYRETKRLAKADEEMRHLVQTFPQIPEAKEHAVDYFLERGDHTKAKHYIDLLEKEKIDNQRIRLLRIGLATATGDSTATLALLRQHTEDMEVSAADKARAWYRFVRDKKSDEGLPSTYNDAFERIIALHPGDLDAVLTYEEVLRLQRDYTRAIELLRPLTVTSPEHPDVWSHLVGNAISLEDNKLVTELSLQALQYIRSDWRYYLYASIGLFGEGKEQEALTLLERALPDLEGIEPNGYSMILAQIGDIYSARKDMVRAYSYYDKALEANPNNTAVLNNYAYFLAEAGEDLERAERMAARGVKIDASNANLLDTYAWIFYKRGNYSLASLYQVKAIDTAGAEASAVMYDHMGDIHLALGERDKALSTWRKALELYEAELQKQDVDDLEETRRKIEILKTKLQSSAQPSK